MSLAKLDRHHVAEVGVADVAEYPSRRGRVPWVASPQESGLHLGTALVVLDGVLVEAALVERVKAPDHVLREGCCTGNHLMMDQLQVVDLQPKVGCECNPPTFVDAMEQHSVVPLEPTRVVRIADDHLHLGKI